jgi:type IV pilus assembly protein PilA
MVFTKFKLRNQKGFTLIELMIVVAIIGILAAIAIPNVITYLKKSKTSEGKQFLATLRTLEEAYKAENDTYTSDKSALGWTRPTNWKYYSTFFMSNIAAATFTVSAHGNIDSDAASDVWTITESGTLAHATID